jgi:adenylate cyclase
MKTSALNTKRSTSLTKLEQRLHLSDFLLKLSNQMSAFGNLDDVLNAFVEIATRELNAERGTIFLNDPTTNELYSRVAQGHLRHEIRILNSSGIAGSVFTAQESLIILDPYDDPRFNQTIDEQTGFVTRSILCVPIRAGNGNVIGVAQLLNKQKGRFTKVDLSLLEKMTTQASLALQNAQFIESMQAIRAKEIEFLNVISEVTSDINISSLLKR